MTYTEKVQQLVANPLGGRTRGQVRELCSSDLAQAALAHDPEPYLVEKYARDNDVEQSEARELFEETKRFLVAGVLLDCQLAPSRPVDDMWHSWILFTKDYHEFCAKIGGYVHHRPLEKGSAAQPPLEPTVEIMEAAFGPCSDRFWPQVLGSYGIMDCKKGV